VRLGSLIDEAKDSPLKQKDSWVRLGSFIAEAESLIAETNRLSRDVR